MEEMEKPKLLIKELDPDVAYVSKGNPNAAGLDLRAAEAYEFRPGEIKVIPLGVIVKAPKGYYTRLVMRSGMSVKGFSLMNAPGTIDADYCGPEDELKAILSWNPSTIEENGELTTEEQYYSRTYFIEAGDRLVQLILEKQYDYEIDKSYEPEGESRDGFGSTGVK